MSDRPWLNEPIPEQRELAVFLQNSSGAGVPGVISATIKIAKPGANLITDGACTLTEITGGVDVGEYRLRLSADAVSAQGECGYEITLPGTIVTCRGSYTVRTLDSLFYGKLTASGSGTTFTLDSANPGGNASGTDGFYAKASVGRLALLFVVSGTGKGQHRLVTDYVGASHQITIDEAFVTALDVSGGANNSIVTIAPIITTPELSTDSRLALINTIYTAVSNISGRIPAALDGAGNIKAGVQTIANGAIAAATFAAGAINAAAVASDALAAIATQIFATLTETGLTFKHAMQLIVSAVGTKNSGNATNAPKFRDFADTKDRVTGTTTSDGRPTVTYLFD